MTTGGTPHSVTNELLTIERVAVLQRVGLFNDVPGHTLVAVARLLEEVRLESDMVVMERGSVEDWLYVIAEGRVRIHIDARSLGEIGAGGVVGELSVLAPAPRAASVTTVEPTLLLRLRHGPFEELLDDRPELARALLSTLARLLQTSANRGSAMAET
jgi:CRP-like cAMP-binding protein